MSYAYNENQFTQEELERMRKDQRLFDGMCDLSERSIQRVLLCISSMDAAKRHLFKPTGAAKGMSNFKGIFGSSP